MSGEGPIRQRIAVRELRSEAELALAVALSEEVYRESEKSLDGLGTRTLGVFDGDQLVGAVSVAFPDPARSRPFQFLPGPLQSARRARARLPAPAETMEVGRLAIRRPWRGSQALLAVFHRLHRELRLSGRSIMLITTDERHLPRYEAVSFRRLGVSFIKRQRSRSERIHVLSSKQRHLGAYGIAAGPGKFRRFVSPAVRELRELGQLRLSSTERIIYPIYEALHAFF